MGAKTAPEEPEKPKTPAKRTRKQAGLEAVDQEAVRVTEEQVMALRIKGYSFREINKSLEITSSDRIFRRAMARQGDNEPYIRAEAIRVEAERLDQLQLGIWERATKGADPKAVEAALKILERRANLFGLDFQHMINSKAIEIEEAKVRMMATALQKALDFFEPTKEQRAQASRIFVGELAVSESNIIDVEPIE